MVSSRGQDGGGAWRATARDMERCVGSISGDINLKAAALANRLRLVQADFADEPAQARTEQMEDEIQRVLATVAPTEREQLLAVLAEKFPSWDTNVAAAPAPAAESKAPVQSIMDRRELQDPSFLVARLVELGGKMSGEDKKAAAAALKGVGIVEQTSSGALPEAQAKALMLALGMNPSDTLDAARLLDLATLLVELAGSLDQVVWNTWKAVAPTSPIKRAGSVKVTMSKFAAGDQDTPRGQVKQDLERLRQLTAALTASVNQAGRSFAQKHIEKFAPAEIENLAKMSSGGLLVSQEVKCWRKYVELAGPVDAQAIERDLLNAIAAYAESLMKGVAR